MATLRLEDRPMALALPDDTTTLRIHYQTDGLLSAVDVAAVLREVATAFERYVRRRARHAHLRLAVRRVEVSSLLADLVVMGAVAGQAVSEHREALYGFVGFIADTLSILKGVKPGKPTLADKRMINALQKPVAEAGAQQVNVFVVGDGNTVTIDREAIQQMQSHSDQASVRVVQQLAAPRAHPDFNQLTRSHPRLLTLDGEFGTVFDVRGQWYVRLEGEEGVLNPLKLEDGVTLQDGRAYQFDGTWEGRRYRIRAARSLT